MKAEFRKALEGNGVAVHLAPESPTEQLLLEAFLRYDQNVFSATVLREHDAPRGAIECVLLKGDDRS